MLPTDALWTGSETRQRPTLSPAMFTEDGLFILAPVEEMFDVVTRIDHRTKLETWHSIALIHSFEGRSDLYHEPMDDD